MVKKLGAGQFGEVWMGESDAPGGYSARTGSHGTVKKVALCRLPGRFLQEQPEGGHQDSEGGNHGALGLPGGGQPHEAAATRQAGAPARRGHQGAHPDRDRVHGQR